MARKSKAEAKKTRTVKKQISLRVKLDIIQRYENGETIPNIAQSCGLKQATIGTIIKFKDKIGDKKVYDSSLTKSVAIKINELNATAEVEKSLALWMTKEGLWKVPLDSSVITQKAMEVYNTLKETHSRKLSEFKPNGKWFKHFKRRHRNLLFNEPKPEKGRTKHILNSLNTIIEENEYSARQVFYIDETVISWKSIPIEYTSLSFAKKIQNLDEPITVLLATNAEADSSIIPLFVYHDENPPELRGITKSSLPLSWASSPDGKMTVENFKEWYFKHFIPETKLYCEVNKIPFKLLLLLRSSRTHPCDLDDFHTDIKVFMIPPNVAAVVTPMRTIYSQLLSNIYVRRLLSNMLESQEREQPMGLEEFWADYNIYCCLKNIKYSSDELTSTYRSAMNAAWKKTYAPFVNTTIDCQTVADEIFQNITDLEKDLTSKYIQNNDEPSKEDETMKDIEIEPTEKNNKTCITKEEQLVVEKESIDKERNEEKNIDTDQTNQTVSLNDSRITKDSTDVTLNLVPVQRKFDKTRLTEAFEKIEDALIILESMDPNCSRSASIANCISNAILPYREIYRNK